MLLNQWHPFFDVSTPFNELNRFFSTVNRPRTSRTATQGLFPTINVYDNGEQTTLVAEIPGVDPNALEVTVLNDTVTLKGSRLNDVEDGQTVHRRERGTGPFSRTLTLPDAVNPETVKAQYQHGILHVTLEKAAVAQAKKIKVQS
jgi:HSP20 family protein